MNREDFVFFWGGPFSQWFPSEFVRDGRTFTCAEQWMMYNKAIMFNDRDTMEKIMATPHPNEQKKLGRKVKNFSDEVWMKDAYNIVVQGNLSKFSQNKACMDYMIATAGREIVEASPYDRRWGIGLGENTPGIEDRSTWRGENLLGRAIMDARLYLIGNHE